MRWQCAVHFRSPRLLWLRGLGPAVLSALQLRPKVVSNVMLRIWLGLVLRVQLRALLGNCSGTKGMCRLIIMAPRKLPGTEGEAALVDGLLLPLPSVHT